MGYRNGLKYAGLACGLSFVLLAGDALAQQCCSVVTPDARCNKSTQQYEVQVKNVCSSTKTLKLCIVSKNGTNRFSRVVGAGQTASLSVGRCDVGFRGRCTSGASFSCP